MWWRGKCGLCLDFLGPPVPYKKYNMIFYSSIPNFKFFQEIIGSLGTDHTFISTIYIN